MLVSRFTCPTYPELLAVTDDILENGLGRAETFVTGANTSYALGKFTSVKSVAVFNYDFEVGFFLPDRLTICPTRRYQKCKSVHRLHS
jgi:hypothetical protein